MTGIAFFDLDRTLLAVNSGGLWIRAEVRQGYITRGQALRALGHLTRYHLGFGRVEAVLREAIETLAGTTEADLSARTAAFYRREVAHRLRPGAGPALEAHAAAGEPRVLLTTSSNYLAHLVQDDLGLEGALCNRFEVDTEGRFTGEPHEPMCYGVGKVTLAQAYAAERGLTLRDCAFYTDSHSDLPMMEAVGRPVAINPDPRLRRVAQKRSWPIHDWGAP